MTDTSTPQALATALAYHKAWTSHNLDQAMTYIADYISCDAPGGRISGAQRYRNFLGGFMTQLTGVETVAAFGDDTTAVLFYYPHTAQARCGTPLPGKGGTAPPARDRGPWNRAPSPPRYAGISHARA